MAPTPCTRAIAPAWTGPTTVCACCPPMMRIWPMGRPRRRHEPAAPEGRSLAAVRPGPRAAFRAAGAAGTDGGSVVEHVRPGHRGEGRHVHAGALRPGVYRRLLPRQLLAHL